MSWIPILLVLCVTSTDTYMSGYTVPSERTPAHCIPSQTVRPFWLGKPGLLLVASGEQPSWCKLCFVMSPLF